MLPFLFEKQFVLQLSLSCQSAKHGVECAFCGMTRAFIEISEGDLGEATSYNKGSVWLFVGMLLNTLVYVAYISRKKYSNSVLKL